MAFNGYTQTYLHEFDKQIISAGTAGLCDSCRFHPGKAVTGAGRDTGTIPFEPTVRNQIDSDALCEKYYPGGRADSALGEGDGTRLWHTNAWAMGWSRDM